MNFEQLNQNRRTELRERWNAASVRRADAMHGFSEHAMRKGADQREKGESEWPGHTMSGPERSGTSSKPIPASDATIYLHGRPIRPHQDGVEWQRAIGIVTNRWRLSVLFAAIVVGTAVVYMLITKPLFESEARLEVDPPGAEVFSLEGNQNGGAATDYMETQAQNLQNDELTIEVIRKLHLDKEPYFGGDPSAISGAGPGSPESAVPLTPAENRALSVFEQSRRVTRDAASRLITVSVAAPDPTLAATVTNTLVSAFIDRDYALRNEAISQSSRWVQRQLEDIRERMNESNRALNHFEAAHGIGAIGDNQDRLSDEMVELNRQLLQAKADRIQLQAYLSKMQDNQDGSLPQINSNPVVQELTKRLAETKANLAENRAIYGGNHPNTKKLQNQSDELEAQLEAQRQEIRKSLNITYTAAQAREQLTESQVQGATRHMAVLAQYGALKKEAEANTQLYQALYQKIKEAAIAAESKSSNIRVVDRARVLDHPTEPHRMRTIALGLVIGLFGGVLVAFVRETIDTRVRTPEDIKRYFGTESVSVVPMIADEPDTVTVRTARHLPVQSANEETPLFQITRPNSPEGEALRSLGVSVRLSRQNTSTPQVLLVVSPFTGEGKTTLSINLALTLAQHGITCIVDADLRNGRVARAVRVHTLNGIREVLAKDMGIDEVVVPVPEIPQLSVLAPGSAPGEPGELLSSTAMLDVIRQLRARFDFVVIDSPPMLLFSDGRALSTFADGVIVVGRSGVTTRSHLQRTLELLDGVRSAPVIQIVLNAAECSIVDYGYYGTDNKPARRTEATRAEGAL